MDTIGDRTHDLPHSKASTLTITPKMQFHHPISQLAHIIPSILSAV